MAFCDLKPVEVCDDSGRATYIIGEVFAAYDGSPVPAVFGWDQVNSVTENKKYITVNTERRDFIVPKKMFSSSADYFTAVTIIECMQKIGGFTYEHHRRLLPLKSDYIETDPMSGAYRGIGKINKADAISAFIMLVNRRLKGIMWILAVMAALIIFLAVHVFFGITLDILLFSALVSAMGGALAAAVFYLVCCLITANRYTSIAGRDPASRERITFVISLEGFSACEACVFDDREMIPWDSFDSYLESDRMFVFFKDDIASVFIPKKAFDKKCIGGISEIISHRLKSKIAGDIS